MSWSRILLLLLIVAVSTTDANTDIWIGGFFNQFLVNASGSPTARNSTGAQHLAAFLMAIDEINNKGDGIYDNLLNGYTLKYGVEEAHGFVGAVTAANSFPKEKDGAVNAPVAYVASLGDREAIPAIDVLQTLGNVLVSARSTSAELSNGRDFPYKVRTCQSDSFAGYVIQQALSHFHYTRIAIFSTVEYFSSQSLEKLLHGHLADLEAPTFEVLFSVVLEPGTDFSAAIADAKASSALVFVLLTDPETTAQLLVKGKQAGLFHVGSTIFGHDVSLVSETNDFVKALDPTRDSDDYFAGFFGFRPKPEFALSHIDTGKDFVRRFLARPNTLSPSCSQDQDDYNHAMFLKNGHCAGLDMSTFAQDGSGLDPYVGNVYDAVIALAFALNNILVIDGVSMSDFKAKDGELLMEELTNHVSFMGATDLVTFSPGLKVKGQVSSAKIGYGDRDSGFTYRPVNHNRDNSWSEVGRWDVEGHWQLCDEHLMAELDGELEPCAHQVVYNTVDGKRGRDRNPDVIERVPTGLVYFFVAMGALALVLLLLLSLYFFRHRESGLVKSSQPPMMAMVLCGEGLVALRLIFSSIVDLDRPNSLWLCNSHKWLGHLGPCMVFGGLFLKMWRVDKIINTRSLKRVKITNNDIFVMGCVTTVLICIYLAVLTAVSEPYIDFTVVTTNNTDVYSYECHEKALEMEEALFALEIFFIIWGVRLTNATKNAPSAVNESVYIAAATTVIVVLAAVGLPLAYLVGLSPVNVEVLGTFLFLVGLYSTTAILFVPKVRDLLEDDGTKSVRLKTRDVKKQVLTGGGKTAQSASAAFNTAEGKLAAANTLALHGFSLDERFMMCQRQLEFWRTMLVAVEERRSSDTGSNSGTAMPSTYHVDESTMEIESGLTAKPTNVAHNHRTSSSVYVDGEGDAATHSLEKVPEDD